MFSEMMNNNRTKALFFDIDGTLLSEKTRRVPDSAKEALKQARAAPQMGQQKPSPFHDVPPRVE